MYSNYTTEFNEYLKLNTTNISEAHAYLFPGTTPQRVTTIQASYSVNIFAQF